MFCYPSLPCTARTQRKAGAGLRLAEMLRQRDLDNAKTASRRTTSAVVAVPAANGEGLNVSLSTVNVTLWPVIHTKVRPPPHCVCECASVCVRVCARACACMLPCLPVFLILTLYFLWAAGGCLFFPTRPPCLALRHHSQNPFFRVYLFTFFSFSFFCFFTTGIQTLLSLQRLGYVCLVPSKLRHQ